MKKIVLYVFLVLAVVVAGGLVYCVGPLLTTQDGLQTVGVLLLHPTQLLKFQPNACVALRKIADNRKEYEKGIEGKFGESIIARVDGIRKHDLGNTAQVLELYYNKNGSYPVSTGVQEINKQDFVASDLANHLSEVTDVTFILYGPYDSDRSVVYWYESDGSSYELFTELQNPEDNECIQERGKCIYRIRNGEVATKKLDM